jgi:hypothetical protein
MLKHRNWLIVTAIVIGSFAPVFALATRVSTSGPARWTLDLLNGPGGTRQSYEPATARFLTALTGGFLLGWGVMVLALRQWVYDAAPEGVRKSVVAGLCAWFLLDSTGSFASGNPWNVFYNVIVLLLAVGPMWRPAS